jgi:hypothetical protein
MLGSVLALSVLALPCPAQQPICKLSDYRFSKAQALFAKIANVFRQPRCANCHGGVDPFAQNTQHAGGTYDVGKTSDGDVNPDTTFGPCQSCHGDFLNWRTAPPDLSFIGKDDVTLCRQIKTNLRTGEEFIAHLQHDGRNPHFIEVGFRGTRGLNEEGRSLVDHYRPEPIQGVTHGQLVSWGSDWLSQLDSTSGLIADGPGSDCGCVQHHYALQVHDSATINMNGVHWETGFATDPIVRIFFDDDGGFRGRTVAASQVGAGTAGPCTIQGGGQMAVSAKGQLTDTTPDSMRVVHAQEMKVTITIDVGNASGSVQCPMGAMTATGPGGASSVNFELLDTSPGSKSQEIPALPGVPGAEGTFWIKLIQID